MDYRSVASGGGGGGGKQRHRSIFRMGGRVKVRKMRNTNFSRKARGNNEIVYV